MSPAVPPPHLWPEVPTTFGNPACWGGEMRFLPCCSTRAYGPGGNAECWRDDLGTSFERCCLRPADDTGDEAAKLSRMRATKKTLEEAQLDFGTAVVALARLMHRLDLERHALGRRRLRADEAHLLSGLNAFVARWRAEHLAQLAAVLPRVLDAYAPLGAPPGRAPPSRGGTPRVAIVTACTPESATSSVCQAGANLWQCYARRHGYNFIFDSIPYPAYPRKFRFSSDTDRGLAAALDADFDESDTMFLFEEPLALQAGTDGTNFKWWQRWYAARRHLAAYDLLLVVDPDTAVFPSCTDVDLVTALGLPEDVAQWPGVIARDPRPAEDLNGGVFALTSSRWGRLFLELLLARSRWPLDVAGGGGWCHARQTAEYETLLEVVALSRAHASGEPLGYDSECMTFAMPQAVDLGEDRQPVAGCIWPAYLACWRQVSQRLAGPSGERASPAVRFVDPREVDINYRPWSNEPRYREPFLNATQVPAVANAAFLWHYVGIPDKVQHLLRDFALGNITDTFDCDWLEKTFANSRGSGALPACTLGGSPVACPFEDSRLMPHAFGC